MRSFIVCAGGIGVDCGPLTQPLVQGVFQSSYTFNGWHGGGTAGFNWQLGPVVLGVEGDISGANLDGRGDCTNAFGPLVGAEVLGLAVFSIESRTRVTWSGTITGRLGVAVDHALFYVKAGGAEAHFKHDIATGFEGIQVPGPSFSLSENRGGFTAGAGIEYAFWGNWSAKLEYDFMDFGTKTVAFAPVANIPTVVPGVPAPALTQFAEDRERIHVIKAGLNYRFWWGKAPWGKAPVVARY